MLDDKCFVFLNLLHCVSINFIKKREKTLIEGEKVVEWMDNASFRRTESHLRRLEIVRTETLHLLPHSLHFLFQRLPKTSKSTSLFTSSMLPPLLYSSHLLCLLIHHPLHILFQRLPNPLLSSPLRCSAHRFTHHFFSVS